MHSRFIRQPISRYCLRTLSDVQTLVYRTNIELVAMFPVYNGRNLQDKTHFGRGSVVRQSYPDTGKLHTG